MSTIVQLLIAGLGVNRFGHLVILLYGSRDRFGIACVRIGRDTLVSARVVPILVKTRIVGIAHELEPSQGFLYLQK